MVDCFQKLTRLAISIPPNRAVKIPVLCLVDYRNLSRRSSFHCPPSELLPEFTTSPHVAVKRSSPMFNILSKCDIIAPVTPGRRGRQHPIPHWFLVF